MPGSVKTKASRKQIKEMVIERLGYDAHLIVHPAGRGLSFAVGILAPRSKAQAAQQEVDDIVAELRAQYELARDA